MTGTVHGMQDGDTTWLYAKELGTAVRARMQLAAASLQRNNHDSKSIGVYVGGVEFVVVRGAFSNEFDVVPVDQNGRKLGAGSFGCGLKDVVAIGRAVRGIFDSAARQQSILANIERAQRDLESLGDLSALRVAEWPGEQELSDMITRKRELDQWFAQQDFNSSDGHDPFLARLALLRNERDLAAQAAVVDDDIELVDDDSLEDIEAAAFAGADELGDLFADEEELVSIATEGGRKKQAGLGLN